MKILTIILAFVLSVLTVSAAPTTAQNLIYKRSDNFWGPATLKLKIKGNKCDFEVSTPTAQGSLRGVSGTANVGHKGTIVYVNHAVNPTEAGTLVIQKVNESTVMISGGSIYCDSYTSLEGTYKLVGNK